MAGSPRLSYGAEDEPLILVPVVAGVPIAALLLRRYAENAVDIGSGIRSTDLELATVNSNHSWLRDDLEPESSQDTEASGTLSAREIFWCQRLPGDIACREPKDRLRGIPPTVN